MGICIDVRGIRKTYSVPTPFNKLILGQKKEIIALQDVSLQVHEGEIFGLLGPNGAGKSTLLKILSTLIVPTAGTASISGYDILRDEREVRSRIGLINSDERSFYWRLTGRQNLEFFAALFSMEREVRDDRINQLLSLVDLDHKADEVFHTYSTGMKQKLAIIRGLMTYPKVLFMDEAMRSIDPISTRNIRNFIKNDARRILGGSIVIATNRLDEAAELCDRVAILDRGAVIFCGGKEELLTSIKGAIHYEIDVGNAGNGIENRIRAVSGVKGCSAGNVTNGSLVLRIALDCEEDALPRVIREIVYHNGDVRRCTRISPSIEDLFEKILGSPTETD